MISTILLTLSSLVSGFGPVDSLRTEVIDGKTYIIHRVEQRETLFAISKKYGVALLSVVESNPEASSGLEVGQLVKVPYSRNNRTKTAEGVVHRVGQKETLYSISKQYGVTVDELKEWNNLTGNALNLGQELLIKDKIPEKKEAGTHTVAPQETMYSISRRYGVSIQQIKDWNKLNTTDLQPGQIINVSGPARSNSSALTSVIKPLEEKTVEAKNTVSEPTNQITIPVTETVIGSDEMHETGMVSILEGTEDNRKYLAYHRSVKPGTILRVKNNLSRKEVFVRVIGKLSSTEASDVLLRVSKSAYDKLGGEGKFPVEVIYFK